MERYTLNDLEKLTGIKTDTIRIWERRYGLLRPELTPTGRRLYSAESLLRLINISILYRNGSKISSIAGLSDGEIAERVAHLKEPGINNDEQIALLLHAMNQLDEKAVDDLLLKLIVARGLESAFEEIVFPFLERVGLMWHTGSVSIATEHFITNIFRRRLIKATDTIPRAYKGNEKKFLLFLPGGELHELGLLFCEYLVARSGNSTLYLGQATPFKAIAEAADSWKPDYAITVTLSGLGIDDPVMNLRKLKEILPGTVLLVSGTLARLDSRDYPEGVVPLSGFKDLKELLKNISLKVG